MQRELRLSRRGLLGGAAALAGASTMIGSAVLTASPAAAESAKSVLVLLSLRGAADGLSLVVPHADPAYYADRPRIAVPASRLIAKDGFFGLHPALSPLLPLWSSGRMAAVHATGLPTVNRSHFSAQEQLEDADPGSSARIGWLNRLVGTTPGSSPLQGFAAGRGVVPTSLYGPETVMSATDATSIGIPGADPKGMRLAALKQIWGSHPTNLGKSMRGTFDAVKDFAPVRSQPYSPASYPDSDLGRAMATAAQVIRGDVGVEILTVDHGDWDMHSRMGTVDAGWLVDQASELASALAAFFDDLGTQASKVTLVSVSEFGRRVVENSNFGTDHGYGNVMFVAGEGVRGGYHGRWPGLSNSYEADLTVTTDYRQVLADVVEARFGASIATVFPGLSHKRTGCMIGL